MSTSTRREFVADAARAVVAAGLALLGAWLVGRGGAASACTPSARCGGCGAYDACAVRLTGGSGRE